MILDLKGKLGELESSEAAVAAMTATEAVTTSNQALAEALEALSAPGYSDREIKRITKQLEALGETTTDVYLSNALKFMMKRWRNNDDRRRTVAFSCKSSRSFN